MKKNVITISIICVILFAANNASYAQLEMQGSQYLVDKTYINPAFTGTDGFANANLQVQMNNLKNSNNTDDHTFSAAASVELRKAKSAVGFNVVKNAFGNDNYTMGYGSYVYHLPVSSSVILSSAVSLGIQQYDIRLINLTTTQENDPLSMQNIYSSNMDARLGVQTTIDNKYYAGISFDNVLSKYAKKDDYLNQMPPTFRRTNMYLIGGAKISTSSDLTLEPSALFVKCFGGVTNLEVHALLTFSKRITFGVGFKQEIEEYQSVSIGNDGNRYKQSILRPIVRYNVPIGNLNWLKIGYCFNFSANQSVGLQRNSHDFSLSMSIFK